MPVLSGKSVSRPLALLLVATSLLLIGAVFVHLVSDLPLRYSWSQTLRLFWQAITDEYFIVMACIALVAATILQQRSPNANDAQAPNHWSIPALTVALLLLLLDLSSDNYGIWDYLLLGPAGGLLFLALYRQRFATAFGGLLAATLILVVVSYVFTIYKSQLFVGRAPLDQLIVDAEALLFSKPIYLTIAQWAAQHPPVVRFCDWVYFLFFHHIALTALFLFASNNTSDQRRYITSMALCYLLGGLSYFLLPALGPAYFDPPSFSYVSSHAPFTAFVQKFLQTTTQLSMQGQLIEIETFAFIACMPSLHMAHETIMLFFARRSLLMLCFSACFWISSFSAVLILGWHYFFDVLGGVLLAALVICIAQKLWPTTAPCKISAQC